MTNRKIQIVWVIWGVCMVFLLTFLVQANTFAAFRSPEFLVFFALVILTAFFPLHYRNHTLTVFQWISLAVFIHYGFAFELLVTQLAVLAALMASGLKKKALYRVPLNSVIFMITSVSAATVFFLTGGQVGASFSLYEHGLAFFFYTAMFLISNHVCIYLARRYLFQIKKQHFLKGLSMELAAAGVFLPLVVVLIVLFDEVGIWAVVLSGIVFIGISIVLKVYNQSERMNHLLKEVTEFGYELNSSMSIDELMGKVRERLDYFLDWDQLYLYRVQDNQLSMMYMDQQSSAPVPIHLRTGDDFSRKVIDSKQMAIADERQQWMLTGKKFSPDLESILAIPLIHQKETKSVITIASKHEKAFRPHQVMIVEIIANMLSVAISNVQNYEKTKQESHHCPLTHLYNFRYFEEQLKKELDRIEEGETISLILLDLDHFKGINDTYGHQSGNDVLCEVANRLESVVPMHATVARYGGEEFVVLLPNCKEQVAYDVGLLIQQSLKTRSISVVNDLLDEGESIDIAVTASIGVASSDPLDEDEGVVDAISLIRRADRAMYNGAKQRGRDRVASFSDVEKIKNAATT